MATRHERRSPEERKRLIEEANAYLDRINANPPEREIDPERLDRYNSPLGFDDQGNPQQPIKRPPGLLGRLKARLFGGS